MTPLFPGVDDAAGAFIRSYCRWVVAPTVQETVTVTGSGGPLVLLPSLLVTDVASVQVAGVAVDLQEVTFTPAGALYRAAGWARGALVVVQMSHGYAVCPDDVRLVAGQLASRLSSGVPVGASLRVGQVQVSGSSAEGGVDSFARAVLDRYRVF